MNFAVIGAGAWGTAFALHLARSGHGVTLVPRRAAQASAIADARENRDYLAGVSLPVEVRVTAETSVALAEADVVLLACPAQSLRETCVRLHAVWPDRARLIVSLAKGLELATHLRPSEIIAENFSHTLVGALTGPTNAREVAIGQPSAMVLAASDPHAFVQEVQTALSGTTMRVYTTEDLAGIEYGGCLKNIYAIAAGCCEGLSLGDNTKAAMLTRALAEMVRVGVRLGAQQETFYGLSGFGDLVATCHGEWSRNREFGVRLGEGKRVADLLTGRKTVVEGYQTTASVADLCAQKKIDAPILAEVRAILFDNKQPAAALNTLMMRGLKRESATAG
jgi:glycerol-3-phosphate dehydrogenase (NAD(P)+)